MLLLVAFLAYNIFHVFLARNVKPSVRQGKTQIFWARLIAAELYSEVAPAACHPEVFRTISSELRLASGIRITVSCCGLLEMAPQTRYSPQKAIANYPAHPSLGQKCFNATLNLPIPIAAKIRCGIVAYPTPR